MRDINEIQQLKIIDRTTQFQIKEVNKKVKANKVIFKDCECELVAQALNTLVAAKESLTII